MGTVIIIKEVADCCFKTANITQAVVHTHPIRPFRSAMGLYKLLVHTAKHL